MTSARFAFLKTETFVNRVSNTRNEMAGLLAELGKISAHKLSTFVIPAISSLV